MVGEPVLAVEDEQLGGALGAQRAGDVLALVVQVRDRPVVLAHEPAHALQRVGRVAGGVVGVDGEEADDARRVVLGGGAQARVPRDDVRAVVAADDQHRGGGGLVAGHGVLLALRVRERQRRDGVAGREHGSAQRFLQRDHAGGGLADALAERRVAARLGEQGAVDLDVEPRPVVRTMSTPARRLRTAASAGSVTAWTAAASVESVITTPSKPAPRAAGPR